MKKKRFVLILGVLFFSLGLATAALAAADQTQKKLVRAPALAPKQDGMHIDVNYAHDWIEGTTSPYGSVVITVADGGGGIKATSAGQADDSGWFASHEWGWDPEQPNIAPGDSVLASSEGITTEVETIGSINAESDFEVDTVSGSIQAPWFSPTPLTVVCEVWVDQGPPSIEIDGVAPNGGDFICNFAPSWDLQPRDPVAVRYIEPDGDTVINIIEPPWARVNYGHDWVGVNYEIGHTFWITITDNLEAVKATTQDESQPGEGWGGDGFDTQGGQWQPEQPDILPGDWVYFQSDDDYTKTISVGEISGTIDLDNNSISGPIYAYGFTGTLDIECHPWGAPGPAPGKSSTADAEGGVPYSCQWTPEEWDIQPGQEVAVMYLEPDALDRVINVFHEPASYLGIEKWADANPGEGGNFSFYLQYSNEGDADAENVVITDTLQGMTYIADTSGLPHAGNGDPIDPLVWDVGTLPPETWVQFEVFVQLTASASDTITNTAEIATSNPYDMGDPGEKVSEWVGHVIPNDTHLNLGKDAWTGDPAPGHEFVWAVNLCNNGGTASSQVTLTDTLPISTTLLGWWSQHPGWNEVSKDAAQLVVSRPSIPGWWCSEVYLNLLLDPNAWHGMSISNTATIYASNDIESDDNYTEHWIQVSQPHTNLGVDKWWNWGQLVPGGEASYAVDAYNNGNVPVSGVTLTDTLPVSTTLIGIWAYDRNWNYLTEVTPVLYDGEIVVWELESIENGTHLNYEIQLAFDPEAVPGTQMLNTIEISPQPDEDDYSDNEDQWLETLFDHGPNLRIRKDGSWDDWGEETRRASYWLNVENVGDVRVENFTITDTYDSKMYLEGEINTEEWRLLNWSDNPASHYFTATFEGLDPGEGTWINFSTITDTSPLPLGLIFTNTAEVSLTPDDTNPDDNVGQKILTTGPDLSIEKSLVAGEVLPGELITFSLDFSNDRPGHEWWWNMQGEALITDTLPSGLEYITSSLSWCGWIEQEWCSFPANVEDNKLGWHMWPFSSGEMYEIQLTVRVTETALGGDTFTNWVEIASTDPVSDTEPYYDNNTESQDVVVPLPNFEVDKVYESSQVAGTLVTYTLTVTNTGFEAGTNVLLSDTLPSVLTYGGGNGTFDGTDVTWNFASIAPNGGTATGWFWATLPCAGQVINEEYRVVSSDQGVDGAQGTPVSFDVLTPTITANVDVSPPYIVAGDLVDFSAQASTDGSTLTEFEWDFGDGSTGTGLSTSHTYTKDDDYTVVFTATDTCDYSTIVETPIVVHPPNLLADFQQSATLASIGEMLYFTDTSTTDGLPISTWEWDFGDGGTPVYTQKAVHTYAEEGQFTVSLTVTDSLGYSDIIVVEDAVTVEKSISEIYLPLIRLDDSGTGSVK